MSRWCTYLVDKLETFLVGHTLVGELDGVEREGGGRVEGDKAGDEKGHSLQRGRIGKTRGVRE